jgi:hypothetical protein
MNESRWSEINAIFEEALGFDTGERSRFIEERCAGEEKLRAEVESLLAAHDRAENFMEQPAAGEVAEEILGLGRWRKRYWALAETRKKGK